MILKYFTGSEYKTIVTEWNNSVKNYKLAEIMWNLSL